MAQTPHANPGLICPLHKVDMETVCHRCPWWVQVRGKNPQTNQEIDEWNCSISILPILLIENAKQIRSGVAATESFRNEMVNSQQKSAEAIVNAALGVQSIIPSFQSDQKLIKG